MRWLICLILLCFLPASAQEHALLYNKTLAATIPNGLYSLTAKAIGEDYTGKSKPQHVYRNRAGDYSIAFNHMSKNVAPKELIAFHTQLKQQLEGKLSGIQWLKDGSQTINGRHWEMLEFKAAEQGYFHHNWLLLTSWKGRLLEIAVTAEDDVEQQREGQIKIFIDSLQITDTP